MYILVSITKHSGPIHLVITSLCSQHLINLTLYCLWI